MMPGFTNMGTTEILLISFALSADAGAVALGAGSLRVTHPMRSALRLAFYFGLFQFLMPFAGWYGGVYLEKHIEQYDHWAAFFILLGVALKMVYEGYHPGNEKRNTDLTKGFQLILVSIATSIDAFAVGLSIALFRAPILFPAAIIGITTFFVSFGGFFAGSKLRSGFGPKMAIAGGAILFLIGLRILWEHLLR